MYAFKTFLCENLKICKRIKGMKKRNENENSREAFARTDLTQWTMKVPKLPSDSTQLKI